MTEPLVALKDLTKSWNGRPVLQGIDLTIQAGEFIGVIGPNGAGKTTLLRLIAKLLEPTGGAILLDGAALADLHQRVVARQVAVVPQSSTPADFAFPALEVVLMGRYPHRGRFANETPEDYAMARNAMEATGTADLAPRSVLELSGGERQRVFIARALAQKPRLLLLDEPTANLDLGHQLQVLELVRRLVRNERLAAVAAIHDLGLASRYCERLVLLRDGKIVADGSPASVLTAARLAEVFGVAAQVTPDPLTGGLTITVLGPV